MGTWSGLIGTLGMLGIVAVVIGLAWRVSPWYLLLLLVFFPAWNNGVLFVAGLVRPLFGRQHVEVVVEEDRIGERVGPAWHWVPLVEIDRVARLGGVWAVLKFSDISIYMPASVIDETCMAHIKAKSRQPDASGAK